MALDAEKILAGLEKLKERSMRCDPWRAPPTGYTTVETEHWWRQLVKRNPRLQEVYDFQRKSYRRRALERRRRNPCVDG